MKLIVYVFGIFDLFYSNYFKMIEYGVGFGGMLIVGVSIDEFVCIYKNFLVVFYEECVVIIFVLKYFNMVILQCLLDYIDWVKDFNIDVFVVGDDWCGKYDYLCDLGVEVYYFFYGEGVSFIKLKK